VRGSLNAVLEPVVGAAAWVVIGGLVLYAKSRGWTAEWEREHRAVSTVALAVVLWAAVGSLVFVIALGVAAAAPVAVSVPWVVRRAFAVIAVAMAGVIAGRLDSLTVARRAPDGRSWLRVYAALIVAVVVLQWLLKGASALPWAATLGAIALIAFAIGTRWQHRPLPTAGN
jgi:hypothetical protein